MTRVATSIIGEVKEVPDDFPRAYLYDFDIDGSEAKSKHKTWLDENIVKMIAADKTKVWKVYLEGTTSRTNTSEYNRLLSGRRVASVVAHLNSKLPGVKWERNEDWNGETRAALDKKAEASEEAIDRAVIVSIRLKSAPPPPPKPKPVLPDFHIPMPDLGLQTHFQIRLLFGVSASIPGVPLEAGVHRFEIWDKKKQMSAAYKLVAAGVAAPIPLPGSITTEGEWNDMTVSKPKWLTDLGGGATMGAAGGLDKTVTLLTLRMTDGVTTVPPDLKLKTGRTWGFGGSVIIGPFVWFPFKTFTRLG